MVKISHQWHTSVGNQIRDISTIESGNFVRIRVDFVYTDKTDESNEIKLVSTEFPLLFASGRSNGTKAKKDLMKIQNDNEKYNLECISIDSYYSWKDLGKENDYKEVRDELKSILKKDENLKDHPIVSETLEKKEEKDAAESSTRAFQFWLHSEEPAVYYLLNKQPSSCIDSNIIELFEKSISNIKNIKNFNPELCVINFVSTNDCCRHCRPLLAEVLCKHSQIHETLERALNIKFKETFKKVILYSECKEFQFKRPEVSKYMTEVDLSCVTDENMFLMAENN